MYTVGQDRAGNMQLVTTRVIFTTPGDTLAPAVVTAALIADETSESGTQVAATSAGVTFSQDEAGVVAYVLVPGQALQSDGAAQTPTAAAIVQVAGAGASGDASAQALADIATRAGKAVIGCHGIGSSSQVELTGLEPDTLYRLFAVGVDSSGNAASTVVQLPFHTTASEQGGSGSGSDSGAAEVAVQSIAVEERHSSDGTWMLQLQVGASLASSAAFYAVVPVEALPLLDLTVDGTAPHVQNNPAWSSPHALSPL